MVYTLITGGTGLLGGFLLSQALQRDWPVIVLVRKTSSRSPRQRIDSLLANWETHRNLPRPVVMEGDLQQAGLGLSPENRQWLARNCRRVIHSAASIAFYEEPSGEPYRTNVAGTRHLLEFCAAVGIRELHHISTAYVCGQRAGRVLESELEAGQTWGNDYERSKVASEKLIRSDPSLGSWNIYRPAIIVGDSQSGFTTTFHGFYTPLQVAWWLTQANVLKTGLDDWFLGQLGLSGRERKNLVPVDWVAAATLDLVAQQPPCGRTYHLTNPAPPTVLEISQAIGDAIRQQPRPGRDKAISLPAGLEEEDFRRHMETYRAYFRDDPVFDQSQLQADLPGRPCPAVNRATLATTGNFALAANFVAPRKPLPKPPFDLEQALVQLPHSPVEPESVSLLLKVTGPGGGDCTLALVRGELVMSMPGRSHDATASIRVRSDIFAAILQKTISLENALRAGLACLAAPAIAMDDALCIVRATLSRFACPVPAGGSAITTCSSRLATA